MKIRVKKCSFFATVFIVFSFFSNAWAYEKANPPYPRTGLYINNMGGWPTYSIGTRLERLKDFDMVYIIATDDVYGSLYAREMRKKNPLQLIIGMGKNGLYFNDPPPLYLYRSYQGRLKSRIVPGQRQIFVDSVTGINSGQENKIDFIYAVIDDDVVKVEALPNDTTITVPTDVNSIYAINQTHEAGSVVRSPIRVSGAGVYGNFSQWCPLVDGKDAGHYLAEKNLLQENDWSLGDFDGLFHDYFHPTISYTGTIDMNNNGVNDWDEMTSDQFYDHWRTGLGNWLAAERTLMESLAPSSLNLMGVNTGGSLSWYYDLLNGHLFEGFLRFSVWRTLTIDLPNWIANGRKPSIMLIEDFIPEKWAADGKDRFSKMRFGLTAAMMYDCYYGMIFGTSYDFPFWYDEFETDMGYPTGSVETLANGLKVRYFDNGVAICNPTGAYQVLNPADVREGPYYRLKAGQDPVVNNGLLFDSPITLYGIQYNKDDLRGDGILLFKNPTTSVSDIIVDGSYNNDTSPGSKPVERYGTWKNYQSVGSTDFSQNNPYWSVIYSSSSDATYLNVGGYYAAVAGTGADSAIWRPTIGIPGYYEISEWHCWYGQTANQYTEATNVPFKIYANGKISLRGIINQNIRAGQWNLLGYVYLPAGTTSYVHISNNANSYVVADAVRFKYMGDNYQPNTTPPNPPQNVRIQQLR